MEGDVSVFAFIGEGEKLQNQYNVKKVALLCYVIKILSDKMLNVWGKMLLAYLLICYVGKIFSDKCWIFEGKRYSHVRSESFPSWTKSSSSYLLVLKYNFKHFVNMLYSKIESLSKSSCGESNRNIDPKTWTNVYYER